MDQRQTVDSLFREHATPLFRYLCTFRLSREETYDLVQDTFVRLLDAGPTKIRKPRVWLFTVGRNLAINRLKREQTRRPDDGAVDEMPDGSPGVLADLMDREDRDRLWEAYAGLPAGDRELLDLYLEHELSCRQIAQVLGRSEVSVRVGMHRSRNRLKRRLRAEPEGKKNVPQPARQRGG